MAEVEARARLEPQIRAEVEAEIRHRDEGLAVRDQAFRALLILIALSACVVIPVFGAVIGLAVRVFLMASGLR
jgi:hypothetical protein